MGFQQPRRFQTYQIIVPSWILPFFFWESKFQRNRIKTSDPYLTQHQLQSLHGPLPSRKAYGLVKLNGVSPESVWCVVGFCAQPLSPTISDKLHKPISTHCCWWTSRERIETAQWTAYSWTGCCRHGIWIGPIYLFVNNICTSTVYIIDVLDLNGTMSEKVRVDCWFQALQGKMSCGFWVKLRFHWNLGLSVHIISYNYVANLRIVTNNNETWSTESSFRTLV